MLNIHLQIKKMLTLMSAEISDKSFLVGFLVSVFAREDGESDVGGNTTVSCSCTYFMFLVSEHDCGTLINQASNYSVLEHSCSQTFNFLLEANKLPS